MNIKIGANVDDLVPQLWFALGICDVEAGQFNVKLVVTSGRDSKHGPNSLHYSGRAVDLRTRDFTPEAKRDFYRYLKGKLDNRGFDVVLEGDHLHIEWDPKTGDAPWLQEVQ